MTQKIFLSLGSNVGDRETNLRRAVEALAGEMTIDRVSSVWSTKPVGVTTQPDFLNIAVAARTLADPTGLLATVKAIEARVGRTPTYRWGPRIIDIDIVLFGDLQLDTPELFIPHCQMASRAFVLAPLNEIAPDVIDPRSGLTIGELLNQAPGKDEVIWTELRV